MPVFKPELDQSYTLSLKYKTGYAKESRFGPRVQYTLSDGQILYVPPVCAAQIQSLHIDAGEQFSLKRYEGSAGQTHWDVNRVQEPNSNGLDRAQQGKTELVSEPCETPAPRPMQTAQRIAAPAASIPPPPTLTTQESQRIFRQLVASIEAAKAAQEFAQSIGLKLTFGPEDVRAMAISGFIEQSRGRRAA